MTAPMVDRCLNHPFDATVGRRVFRDRLCKKCWQGEQRALGRPDMAVRTVPRPAACPRCQSAYLRQHPEQPEVTCPLCGWEALCEPAGGWKDRHFAQRPRGSQDVPAVVMGLLAGRGATRRR